MRSDVDWNDVKQEVVCDHGEYEYCSDCEMSFIRQVQADAMREAHQVLRRCWKDADKRSTMAEYHVMVAKRLEQRVKEIKEGK